MLAVPDWGSPAMPAPLHKLPMGGLRTCVSALESCALGLRLRAHPVHVAGGSRLGDTGSPGPPAQAVRGWTGNRWRHGLHETKAEKLPFVGSPLLVVRLRKGTPSFLKAGLRSGPKGARGEKLGAPRPGGGLSPTPGGEAQNGLSQNCLTTFILFSSF